MHFDPEEYIKDVCNDLSQCENGKVFVTVSGGVDSSVSAKLAEKAGLENELIFIDTGFLRINEPKTVKKYLKNVEVIDAGNLFRKNLKNKITPAEKREVFRKTYFKVIKKYALKNNFSCIVQGTQFHKSGTKRYHNSPTREFLKSRIKVIEPVKGLTKEHIRLIAKKLNLPQEIINRRPFPGPGLLIRFGGEYKKEKLELIKKITYIVDSFVGQHKKDFENCYQIFPYLMDEHVPFVNKFHRGSNGPIVLIRAISDHTIKNNIIYKPFTISIDLQEKLVNKIMALGNISRVCFDSTVKNGFGDKIKSGGTIEYA
jgi:GMP synthase (glutamine-hydrolysing)